MSKKKLILIIVGGLVIIALIVFGLTKLLNKTNQKTEQVFKVEYLSPAEKNMFNIDPNLKVQALQRDSNNNVTIYKIIKNNSDVVTDLSQIQAQRPPRPDKANQK